MQHLYYLSKNMARYFIELAYNGTLYFGWQVQPNVPSVQEEVSTNLAKVLRHEINLIGAGRTDTGVHASYFVAHFETPTPIEQPNKLLFKLNRMLPNDISLFSLIEVPSDLHARFSATSRTYHYYINNVKDPFASEMSWHYNLPLSLDKMNEAAHSLLKYIDFTSFSKLHTQAKTNNCVISQAQWYEIPNGLVFQITADRFLRNMVRAIVGTMLLVGREKINLSQFEQIIESKQRSRAGTSVKPQGLFLVDISYPNNFERIYPLQFHSEQPSLLKLR